MHDAGRADARFAPELLLAAQGPGLTASARRCSTSTAC